MEISHGNADRLQIGSRYDRLLPMYHSRRRENQVSRRGAYTVRSLAGLLNRCGLVSEQSIRQIPTAYRCIGIILVSFESQLCESNDSTFQSNRLGSRFILPGVR